MTARDRMLVNIRQALGADVVGTSPQAIARAPVSSSAQSPGRASEFAGALAALGGRVVEAANRAEARAKIEELLAGRTYIASAAPIVRACGFTSEFSREACAAREFGITSADFALADTGSLVFLSQSGESRLISLLPPRHIAVIERDKILADLDELFARVPYPAALSSSMVIVTGPSRTADIEMRLVRGVHGPGDVTVIIVNQM
jgi:L-lactate dehydrogenase complex protein LldG